LPVIRDSIGSPSSGVDWVRAEEAFCSCVPRWLESGQSGPFHDLAMRFQLGAGEFALLVPDD
jgi:hypothetical protein